MKNLSSSANTFLAYIGIGVLALPLAILLSVIYGFYFSHLWNWFIVPATNFPVLTIIQAMGLSFFVSFLRTTYWSIEKDDDKKENNFMDALKPTIVFCVGWLFHYVTTTWF